MRSQIPARIRPRSETLESDRLRQWRRLLPPAAAAAALPWAVGGARPCVCVDGARSNSEFERVVAAVGAPAGSEARRVPPCERAARSRPDSSMSERFSCWSVRIACACCSISSCCSTSASTVATGIFATGERLSSVGNKRLPPAEFEQLRDSSLFARNAHAYLWYTFEVRSCDVT